MTNYFYHSNILTSYDMDYFVVTCETKTFSENHETRRNKNSFYGPLDVNLNQAFL